jgi:hypothetical protein
MAREKVAAESRGLVSVLGVEAPPNPYFWPRPEARIHRTPKNSAKTHDRASVERVKPPRSRPDSLLTGRVAERYRPRTELVSVRSRALLQRIDCIGPNGHDSPMHSPDLVAHETAAVDLARLRA